MSDPEKTRAGRDDRAAREDEDQLLEDLEPAEGDDAAVKGGGPRNGTAQIGGGPGD